MWEDYSSVLEKHNQTILENTICACGIVLPYYNINVCKVQKRGKILNFYYLPRSIIADGQRAYFEIVLISRGNAEVAFIGY